MVYTFIRNPWLRLLTSLTLFLFAFMMTSALLESSHLVRMFRRSETFTEVLQRLNRDNNNNNNNSLSDTGERITLSDIPKSDDFPELPEGATRLVVLLTYQKSGSSFLGELFNNNEDAFYWFEPLDGAYSSMYGVGMGWTVPSDITNFPNGTGRSPSPHELQVVENTMRGIMDCDFRRIPNDVFVHNYFTFFRFLQKRMKTYTGCIKRASKKYKQKNKCREHLKKMCPIRYGRNPVAMETCRHILPWNYTAEGKSGRLVPDTSPVDQSRLTSPVRVPRTKGELSPAQRAAFDPTLACKEQEREMAFTCVRHLEEMCKPATVRSVKAIRLTMDSVERLLDVYPDLRVVHFYRDPRAVALSRLGHSSYLGIYSARDKDIIKEAKLYCQTLARDLLIRRKLQALHPNSFLEVLFEELASDPESTAEKIYKFIDLEMPSTVSNWLAVNTNGTSLKGGKTNKNSTAILSKWQGTLPFTTVKSINHVCKELFDLVEDKWPGVTM